MGFYGILPQEDEENWLKICLDILLKRLGSIDVTFNHTQSSLSEAVTSLSGAHLFAVLYIFIVWMTNRDNQPLRSYAFCLNSKILKNGSK